MAKNKPKKLDQFKLGFWNMVRDVLIASMNKGQFPLALIGVIVLTLIMKMPQEDVAKLVFEIWYNILNGKLISSVLFVATALGWTAHAKWQRRMITNEMERISGERTRLQQQALGGNLSSSKGR